MNATVKQLAAHLGLSESRIRHYLGQPEAPGPVKTGRHIYQGRTPNYYNLEEFKKYYENSTQRRASHRW